MPLYNYKVVGVDGDIHEGIMDASTQDEVAEKLQNSGNVPLHIHQNENDSKISSRFPNFLSSRGQISSNEITLFTRELSTILEAGLALDHALEILESLSSKPALKKIIKSLNQQIKGGATFSTALAAHSEQFDALYLNTVRAGEAGGAISIVLERLADYLERAAELRSTIISALFYPAILCFVSLLSIFALLNFIVPKFVPLFEDAGQSLPVLTQFVFFLAGLVQNYWWMALFFVALIAWLVDRQLKKPQSRIRFDRWLLGIPMLGELITKIDVARFSRTLATLLTNGVPLLKAISIVKEVVANRVLSAVVGDASTDLEQGNRLARPLAQSQLFPLLSIQLIQVGEETGQLESMLYKIADIYEREAKEMINRILILLEPVLILGLGAVIAVIIISILIAMLGLNDLIT
ncbi:MAG: type II secretion system F family protein [Gammaproteobacteria bacterium]|nr:type II secretion system F family protein [Gammaproteobacteria bacterium]